MLRGKSAVKDFALVRLVIVIYALAFGFSGARARDLRRNQLLRRWNLRDDRFEAREIKRADVEFAGIEERV